MSVTVVSCVYGTFSGFVPRWANAVAALEPAADALIVATDAPLEIPGARVIDSLCPWKHRQAFYLQTAIEAAETEWVWIVDIDDAALPDGLQGLEDVDADVWQLGFRRSDFATHIPPMLTNEEYLASDQNHYSAGSAIRVEAFHDVGGFRDVAFQDWALWRALARNGNVIEPSGRTHYRYMRHGATRTETELFPKLRAAHVAEMMEAELAYA